MKLQNCHLMLFFLVSPKSQKLQLDSSKMELELQLIEAVQLHVVSDSHIACLCCSS